MSPFEGPMPLNKLHEFLLDPHDLTEVEFRRMLNHLALDSRIRQILDRIITNDDGTEFLHLWDVMIHLGFFESKGDIRKMMQNNGLFLNKNRLQLNTILNESMFFDSGIQWDENTRLKFLVVRKGKRESELIFGLFRITSVPLE